MLKLEKQLNNIIIDNNIEELDKFFYVLSSDYIEYFIEEICSKEISYINVDIFKYILTNYELSDTYINNILRNSAYYGNIHIAKFILINYNNRVMESVIEYILDFHDYDYNQNYMKLIHIYKYFKTVDISPDNSKNILILG